MTDIRTLDRNHSGRLVNAEIEQRGPIQFTHQRFTGPAACVVKKARPMTDAINYASDDCSGVSGSGLARKRLSAPKRAAPH